MTEMDQKIKILEEQAAFQELTIDKLNEALIDQQQQLLRLEEKLDSLAREFRENMAEKDPLQNEPPPPHY